MAQLNPLGRLKHIGRRRPDYVWTPPAYLGVIAWTIAILVHGTILWGAWAPVISLDELVMIGNSRVIAGVPNDWQMAGSGFMPGLAILIAPVWWFTEDPLTAYRVGILISVAVSIATIWPLSRIAVIAGARSTAAVPIATVVVLAPATVLFSNYMFSESLLLLGTAMVILAGHRLAHSLTWQDALYFAGTVGIATVAHGRGAAVALAAGVWCLTLLRKRFSIAVLAGLSSLLIALSVYWFYNAISGRLFESDDRVSNVLDGVLGRDLQEVFATMLGQVWYAAFSWPALVLLGVVLVLARIRTEPTARLVFIIVLVGFLFSTMQLDKSEGGLRIDSWFYGRYMTHAWTILAVIGLVVLIRMKWPVLSAAVVGLSGLIAGTWFLFSVPLMPKDRPWQDMHILGVSPWLSLDAFVDGRDQQWALLAGVTVLFTLVIVVLGLMRAWVIPVLAGSWIALSLAHDNIIDLRMGDRSTYRTLGVEHVPGNFTVGINPDIGINRNIVLFAVTPRDFQLTTTDEVPDEIELVYTGFSDRRPVESGARVLEPSREGLLVGWVFPGPLHDELDRRGLLEPPPYAD